MGFFNSKNPVEESKSILRHYFETNRMQELFGKFDNFIYNLKELYCANEDFINKNAGKVKIGDAGYYNLSNLTRKTNFGADYLRAYAMVFSSNVAISLFLNWISERRRIVEKFGPIATYDLYLPNAVSSETFNRFLKRFVACARYSEHEQQDAINYIRIDMLSLGVISEDLEDSWDDNKIGEHLKRIFFYMNLALKDYKQEPFSKKLALISKIHHKLETYRLQGKCIRIELEDYKNIIEDLYYSTQRNEIKIDEIIKAMGHVNDLIIDARLKYNNLKNEHYDQDLFDLLRTKFISIIYERANSKDEICASSIYRELDDVYHDYAHYCLAHNRFPKVLPEDPKDLSFCSMTHPKKCFDDNALFNYTDSIKNLHDVLYAYKQFDSEVLSRFLPCLKLVRGKEIRSVRGSRLIVQVDDKTRELNATYKTKYLLGGERSLLSSLDFVPSKEGVWEFFLLVTKYDFNVIISEQSLLDRISDPKQICRYGYIDDFSGWDFVPKISESDEFYYISFVELSYNRNYELSYRQCCIDKCMPHTIQYNNILKSETIGCMVLY